MIRLTTKLGGMWKNWVLKTEVNGTARKGGNARLPTMTARLIPGLQGEHASGLRQRARTGDPMHACAVAPLGIEDDRGRMAGAAPARADGADPPTAAHG